MQADDSLNTQDEALRSNSRKGIVAKVLRPYIHRFLGFRLTFPNNMITFRKIGVGQSKLHRGKYSKLRSQQISRCVKNLVFPIYFQFADNFRLRRHPAFSPASAHRSEHHAAAANHVLAIRHQHDKPHNSASHNGSCYATVLLHHPDGIIFGVSATLGQ